MIFEAKGKRLALYALIKKEGSQSSSITAHKGNEKKVGGLISRQEVTQVLSAGEHPRFRFKFDSREESGGQSAILVESPRIALVPELPRC